MQCRELCQRHTVFEFDGRRAVARMDVTLKDDVAAAAAAAEPGERPTEYGGAGTCASLLDDQRGVLMIVVMECDEAAIGDLGGSLVVDVAKHFARPGCKEDVAFTIQTVIESQDRQAGGN